MRILSLTSLAALTLCGSLACSSSSKNTMADTDDDSMPSMASIETMPSMDSAPDRPKMAGADDKNSCTGLVIFFESGEDKLNSAASSSLGRLAQCIKNKEAREVVITGRTDQNGDPAANDMLSQRRAESVLAELRRMGINDTEVVIKAEGEDAASDAKILWPFDRRAEIDVKEGG